jgi:endonuclease YncB( thermonuclease family)
MGTGFAARLKSQKDMVVRGAGFALAAATVCAALFAGSVLRDPAPAVSPESPGTAAPDGKDQTRVAIAAGRTPAQADGVAGMGGANTAADAEAAAEWRDEEFSLVGIVDGRTLSAGDITITLAGLALPPLDQVCRTLDDRLEPCAARAATQLELMTRSRRIACRYRMTTASAGVGSCRVGSRDLAERMIRTGYAKSADGATAVVANAGLADASAR